MKLTSPERMTITKQNRYMNKTIFALIVCVFVNLSLGQSAPYNIESIKAFLYYNQNSSQNSKKVVGTFSQNLIDNETFAFWNPIIAEGDAEGCSNQIMVVVEISGNPKEYVQREIQLKATVGNKTKFERKNTFAIIDKAGRYCIAYMLYDVLCEPLKITATIIGKGIESKIEKIIPFECGE